MSANLAQEIRSHLAAKGLVPNQQWLNSFITSTTQTPTIKQTAWFQLLRTDITRTLERSKDTEFPEDILNGQMKERRLRGPIAVQVLDIEDIGKSKWSQVEALEAEERGETRKGHEIIRVVPGETDNNGTDNGTAGMHQQTSPSSGPHKLTLQDTRGSLIFGFEMNRIDGINLAKLDIGAKLLLRDITVARAVVLLDPRNCTLLGGKIEAMHNDWKAGRKERLKLQAQAERSAGG